MKNRLLASKANFEVYRVGYSARRRTSSHHHNVYYEWVLYIELLYCEADLIHGVVFYTSQQDESLPPIRRVCSRTVSKSSAEASSVVRFQTRVRSLDINHPPNVPKVKLLGRDGSSQVTIRSPISSHNGSAKPCGIPRFVYEASENSGRIQKSEPQSVDFLSEKRTFGVELELSDELGSSHSQIAHSIERRSGESVVVREYRDAKTPVSGWKLVHDGCIPSSRISPDCSKFEIVSPILCGEKGIKSCYKVLEALEASTKTSISVNRTMGFHVHISVERMSLQQLKKVCQNFVKFEDAMDSFMPLSRRTGSSDSDRYFQSCKEAIRNPGGSIAKLNGGRHRAIQACSTRKELCQLMNPMGWYYKLNLQNLITRNSSRQHPTCCIEFRQHSATADPDKVSAWVRFCVAFVQNSALGPTPDFLKNSCGAVEQFDLLFDIVIKDPVLKDFFRDRRAKLAAAEHV